MFRKLEMMLQTSILFSSEARVLYVFCGPGIGTDGLHNFGGPMVHKKY